MKQKVTATRPVDRRTAVAGGTLAGRPRRWSEWARALARRHRRGVRRWQGVALVLRRPLRSMERVLTQRSTAVRLFAPALHLRLAVFPAFRVSTPPRPWTACGTAAPSYGRPGARGMTNVGRRGDALATGFAAAVSGVRILLASARRTAFPGRLAPASARRTAFPGRLAPASVRRGDAAVPRPSGEPSRRTPQVAAGAEAVVLIQRAVRPRVEQRSLVSRPRTLRRPGARERAAAVERPAPSELVPAPAAGTFLRSGMDTVPQPPPLDVSALTDQVMRQIDRRMTSWRERTGRL